MDAPPRRWPRWLWSAALFIAVLLFGWQKQRDDMRARAAAMRATSEINARLEEMRPASKGER